MKAREVQTTHTPSIEAAGAQAILKQQLEALKSSFRFQLQQVCNPTSNSMIL